MLKMIDYTDLSQHANPDIHYLHTHAYMSVTCTMHTLHIPCIILLSGTTTCHITNLSSCILISLSPPVHNINVDHEDNDDQDDHK